MSPRAKPAFEVVEGMTYADWEAVYRDNVVAVYRRLQARVGNRPDAEDLTTEVFLRALPRLRFPTSVGAARTYLMATVKTVLAEHWRQAYAVPPLTELLDGQGSPAAAAATTDDQADRRRGEERARRLLSLLPDLLRRVLELRFLHGYSPSEVAAELGLSPGHVRVLQYRALRQAAALEEGEER